MLQELFDVFTHDTALATLAVEGHGATSKFTLAVGSEMGGRVISCAHAAFGREPARWAMTKALPFARTSPAQAQSVVVPPAEAGGGAWIALVERGGGATFVQKAQRVAAAGAVAMVVFNSSGRKSDVDEVLRPGMGAAERDAAASVDIPVLGIRSQDAVRGPFSDAVALRAQPLRVHYIGEEGIDDGGLSRDFFRAVVQMVVEPKVGLFVSTAVDNVRSACPPPLRRPPCVLSEDSSHAHLLTVLMPIILSAAAGLLSTPTTSHRAPRA